MAELWLVTSFIAGVIFTLLIIIGSKNKEKNHVEDLLEEWDAQDQLEELEEEEVLEDEQDVQDLMDILFLDEEEEEE